MSTLCDGLYFANGVTATADGTALVFAETQGRRLSKYWLSGPQAGTITPLAINLPGMPDNISTGADGRIWVAFVTPINAAAEWLARDRPFCANWCGDCRTRCSRRWRWRCGASLSTPTAAPRSRACAASTVSSDR